MASGLDLVFRKARSAEKRGDEAEARRLLEEVLASYPKNATARQALARLGGGAAAPADLDALIAAHQRGDASATIRIGEALAERAPADETVLTLIGAARLTLRDYAGAADAFGRAARANPAHAPHHNNLCVALRGDERLEEASRACAEAVRLDPDYTDAWYNRAIIEEALARFDAAIDALEQVLRLAPDRVDAQSWLGGLYRHTKRFPEAIESYVKALALAPDHGQTLRHLGSTLIELGHAERAVETLRLAVKADPTHADAHSDLGLALERLGKRDEAILAFAKATEFAPDNYAIWGRLLSLQAYQCDWTSRAAFAMLPIAAGTTGLPFDALPFEDAPERQLERSRAYANRLLSAAPQVPFIAPPARTEGRIRIGYLSADFYNHATMHLMAGLFREHDRTRFEIVVYDFSPSAGAETQAVADRVDRYVPLHHLTDRDAAALIRGDALDIAIDLKGYTKDCRPRLFADRVAPVQISYLGYPGSVGIAAMDYILADAVVIPEGAEAGYSERIIRLPGSYQPNDDRRAIAAIEDDRAAHGLPADGFVFCSFNQGYKIGPAEFDIWMRLLRAAEGSVLWLLDSGEKATANLRREAAARGVDPDRLVIAPSRRHDLHLARQRHADLFLDTFAVNAHTTASDALWGGLPVLTMAGRQFAARVAASLVTAVGLPDMATDTPEAYFARALELASSPEKMAEVKARLAANRLTHPLYDSAGYARRIEAAYEAAHRRRVEGLKPDHIRIG